jgi:hypothetical protein
MNSLRIVALVTWVALTLFAVAPAAHAQNTVGTITQLQGTANIQRGGATTPAAINMPVLLHDKIVTAPNSSLTIGLVDNSSLQLGASATLSIDESVLVNGVGAPSKVGLLGGQLHSLIVGAMRGGSTTFEVHTPNAIGAVRGTDWTENFDQTPRQGYEDCNQFTDVDVNSGTVRVCNTATPPDCKDVDAGHHTTVACGGFLVGSTGGVGATVLGVGLAAGVGVGAAAGAGAFGGGGSTPPPQKHTPSQ